jgi:hypothetical protein
MFPERTSADGESVIEVKDIIVGNKLAERVVTEPQQITKG